MKKDYKVPHWPVDPAIIEQARERKRKLGVPITSTIDDALTFAFAQENREKWFQTETKGDSNERS